MKKMTIKLLIDVVLCCIWVSLMTYNFTGAFMHEVLGIGILILLILHIGLNHKWICKVTATFFDDGFNLNKARYICDLVLLILSIFTGISGVIISKELFPFFSIGSYGVLSSLHNIAAYGSLIVIGIHVGFHIKMIIGYFRNLFKIKSVSRARNIACKLIAVAIILYGIKASNDYGVPNLYIPSNNTGNSRVSITNPANTALAISTGYSIVQMVSETPSAGESLEDYLGRLICTGCHKNCSLLSPQCGKGRQQVAQATEIYTSSTEAVPTSAPTAPQSSSDITANNSTKTDENNSAINSTPTAVPETPTLEDYLSKLFCTGCSRHCSLLSPQCSKGTAQAEQAQREYSQTVAVENATAAPTQGREQATTGDKNATQPTTQQPTQSPSATSTIPDTPENPVEKLLTQPLPIIGMYSTITYYLSELLTRKRKKKPSDRSYR